MLSKYKAVIFDWDGTLVDTCGLVLDAHNHVRQFMGHKLWTMDDFLGQASKSAREYYPEIYGDRAEEAQTLLYDFVGENHLTYLKPMDQSREFLDFVKTMNMPMAIVSNKRHDFMVKEVGVMEWHDYFVSLVGAGQAAKDKPSADPLLAAIAEIDGKLKPTDILYVGDTETDLICAKNAGCPVVFIQSDKPRPDLIEAYKPDHSFHSLAEFLNMLNNNDTVKLNKAC